MGQVFGRGFDSRQVHTERTILFGSKRHSQQTVPLLLLKSAAGSRFSAHEVPQKKIALPRDAL